jgi:4-oxalocrotonate tautomerase
MPHIIVKMFEGRSEEQKQVLSADLTAAIMSSLSCAEGSVSVAIEDIRKDDWTDKVYVPDIQQKSELIYKEPGYNPFK